MDTFETQTEDETVPPTMDISTHEAISTSKKSGCLVLVLLVIVGILTLFWYFFIPPTSFPLQSYLRVTETTTVSSLADDAYNAHMIRSAKVFRGLLALSGADRHLTTGDYYFDRPVGLIPLVGRIARGDFRIQQAKVTLPEGTTRKQMAQILSVSLPKFVSADFLEATKNDEGFLFPDTYYFSPQSTATDVITRLKENYESRVAPYRTEMKKSGMSEHDVITLASIIEKEAHGDEDRATIAGILEKRLNQGIPLQVDASFVYLLGKESNQLTLADLKVDSPYNTYIHKGLPPTPIDNPGLASILAVIHPKITSYLFYLHDANGVAHYAVTFEEHKKNKALYLH